MTQLACSIWELRRQRIMLYCGDWRDLDLDGLVDFALWDPSWQYDDNPRGGAARHYTTHPMRRLVDEWWSIGGLMAPDRYGATWCTYPMIFPFLGEVGRRMGGGLEASEDIDQLTLGPWRGITGGSWHKTQKGIGTHLRGNAEPWLLWGVGQPRPFAAAPDGGYISPRGAHSAKPTGYLVRLLTSLCPPGGTVLEPYAGSGNGAAAALHAGCSYLGAEIDPHRYRQAVGRIELALHGLGVSPKAVVRA